MRLSALDEYRTVEFIHHNTAIQTHIMEHFCQCRASNRFIDLEVEVQGVVFPCHKLLLDSFCPYFAASFSFHEESLKASGMENGTIGPVERMVLSYNGVTVAGFSRLLDYMYTSELQVNVEDVIDVLRCADFLQFRNVVELCSGFMQQHITAETCLQVLFLAQAHDLQDLYEKALTFITTNLSDVIHQSDFGNLSSENVIKIISNPNLEVPSEALVIQAVLIWVNANNAERVSLLPDLFKYARIRPVDLQELKTIYFSEDTKITSMQEIVSPQYLWNLFSKDVAISPLSDRLTEVLVIVSRETERKHRGVIKDLSTVYFYDPEALRWEKMTKLPFDNRQFYTAAVLNNILYLVGGLSIDSLDINCTKVVFNDCWSYNPSAEGWTERQSMLIPRYNHSSSAMQGKLYVVGGQAASTGLNLRGDGEAYDPHADQWTMISPLRCVSGIGNAALTALDGKLYICGGTHSYLDKRNEINFDSYLGAQVYDPEEDLWHELLVLEHEITKNNIRISSGDMLAVDGFLLLLDDDTGKSHYIYNPVSRSVRSLVRAHGHHRFAGWAVYRGHLVCTGGVEDERFGMTDMVHAWDLADRHHGWSMMPPLPSSLSHHACLIMHIHLLRVDTTGQYNHENVDSSDIEI